MVHCRNVLAIATPTTAKDKNNYNKSKIKIKITVHYFEEDQSACLENCFTSIRVFAIDVKEINVSLISRFLYDKTDMKLQQSK